MEAVTTITSLAQFEETIRNTPQTVVVDFHAQWCGPCAMMGPRFVEFSTKYTNLMFLRVDVDEVEDLAEKYGVDCMPTFQFFKGGEKVHEFSGANAEKLEESLKTYAEN